MEGTEEAEANLMEPKVNTETGQCRCRICDLWYQDRDSFGAHRRRKHGTTRNTLCCPAPDGTDCAKSPSMEALRLHLEKNHGFASHAEKHMFGSKVDFFKWKEDVQTTSKSQFVRHRANEGCEQWHCNRSGLKQPQRRSTEGQQSDRKKPAPRGKGSEKTGTQCPAMISAKYSDDGRRVAVIAYLSHLGHEQDICFLSLSSAARE